MSFRSVYLDKLADEHTCHRVRQDRLSYNVNNKGFNMWEDYSVQDDVDSREIALYRLWDKLEEELDYVNDCKW